MNFMKLFVKVCNFTFLVQINDHGSTRSQQDFQISYYSPFILRRQLNDPHFFQSCGHFQLAREDLA